MLREEIDSQISVEYHEDAEDGASFVLVAITMGHTRTQIGFSTEQARVIKSFLDDMFPAAEECDRRADALLARDTRALAPAVL